MMNMAQVDWHFEPAPDIDQSFIERLRTFPRQPDMMIYGLRSLAALMLRAWLKTYHRLRIEGLENLPTDGSFVLVANHCSHLDVPCLLSALPLRKLHRAFPAAAKDYFFVNLRRTAFAAIFINAMPFSRKGEVRHGLEVCQALLSNPGNILILFPEGTRSTTGQLGAFRPGIGLLVAGTDLPVVPCALQGTFAALPKSVIWPRPRAIRLVIGHPRRFADLPADKESAYAIAQELQGAVQELL
jgi:1-acyl-sn-glycerol-3-phosphate acyltransferase